MIEPEIAFADLSDNASLAEGLLKYTFATLLKEREEDLAFFDERIEKGLVAKLEGIVGSEFVHMDYGEAIQVLERAKQKFEFPVERGIDLQSEHERYLTEKHAKKPVIVMNYPKAIKAFYMRVNDDGLLSDRVCVRRRWALDAYGAVTATRGFRFVRSATDSPNSDPSLRT
jgi:asparaginyl-tRNA synthetase